VVSATDRHGRILDFLDKSVLFLSSSSLVVLTRLSEPRSDPLLTKSGSAGNRTRTCGTLTTRLQRRSTHKYGRPSRTYMMNKIHTLQKAKHG
jgi:hypothetical protein